MAFGSVNSLPSGTAWILFVWSCMGKEEKKAVEKKRQIDEMLREIDRGTNSRQIYNRIVF